MGSYEVGKREVDSCELRSCEPGSCEVRSLKVGSPEVCPFQVGRPESHSLKICLPQVEGLILALTIVARAPRKNSEDCANIRWLQEKWIGFFSTTNVHFYHRPMSSSRVPSDAFECVDPTEANL